MLIRHYASGTFALVSTSPRMLLEWIQVCHFWIYLCRRIVSMIILIPIWLQYRVNNPCPVIQVILHLSLCFLSSLFYHLLISLDLYLQNAVLISDCVELLCVLIIVDFDLLHAALHYVTFTFDLWMDDLLIDDMNTLLVRIVTLSITFWKLAWQLRV
jgi:hypothetical protein